MPCVDPLFRCTVSFGFHCTAIPPFDELLGMEGGGLFQMRRIDCKTLFRESEPSFHHCAPDALTIVYFDHGNLLSIGYEQMKLVLARHVARGFEHRAEGLVSLQGARVEASFTGET